MSKIADYREQLKSMDYWDDYLIKESRPPGPRANLELAYAVADLENRKYHQILNHDLVYLRCP